MELLYDGFHRIEAVNATVNGQQKQYEKLHLKSAVAGMVVDDAGYMCLVRQYRPSIGDYTLEVPAGVLDKPGLSKIETLFEELEEECLIDKQDIIRYGEEPIQEYCMIIGSSDATCSIYYVEVKDQFQKELENFSDEVSSVHWYGSKELARLLNEGAIKDPKTLIAVNYYLNDFLGHGI